MFYPTHPILSFAFLDGNEIKRPKKYDEHGNEIKRKKKKKKKKGKKDDDNVVDESDVSASESDYTDSEASNSAAHYHESSTMPALEPMMKDEKIYDV